MAIWNTGECDIDIISSTPRLPNSPDLHFNVYLSIYKYQIHCKAICPSSSWGTIPPLSTVLILFTYKMFWQGIENALNWKSIKMKWKENNEKQTNSRAGRKFEMAGQSDLSWSHYALHADHHPDCCRWRRLSWLWQVQTMGNAIAWVTVAITDSVLD